MSTAKSHEVKHPRFAQMYMRCAASADARGGAEHRRKLLAGLRGTVLEVGAGHGVNFQYYPRTVTKLIAVEPEPTLYTAATEAARTAQIPVEVVSGTAEHLPVEDAGVDAAVASLVLCSVSSQRLALNELHRALRPGGELRFYEHVIGGGAPKRLMLWALDHSGLWPRLAGGCHPARDTAGAIASAGFEIDSCERFMFAANRFEPSIPHILGAARRLR